jgi:hypothetical protein
VNCTNGGQKVQVGVDDNSNTILDAPEIDSTSLVCNGVNGTNGTNGTDGSNGTNGANGLNSLVKVTPELPGATCTSGGQKIESGLDDNANAVLDAGEVDSTQYVCSGSDGINGVNGKNSLSLLTNEPAGANCPYGGKRIDVGLDDNFNSVLEALEIDSTSYVCSYGAGVNAGSIASPVSLTLGTTKYTSVAAGGASFYQFTPTETRQYYFRTEKVSSDISWSLYSDSAFSTLVKTCNSSVDWEYSGSDYCSTGVSLNSGQTYYLKVNELLNMPNLFTIRIGGVYFSEGTLATPVDMGTAPVLAFNGESGWGSPNYSSYSYYTVAVTPGMAYVITVTNMSDTLSASVSENGFSTTLCSTGTGSTSIYCTTPSVTASSIVIRVDNGWTFASYGSKYRISVAQAPVSEGSVATPLNVAVTPHTGQVAAYGYSYYTIPVTAGSYYTISMTSLSNTGSLSVYGNADYSTGFLCSSYNSGVADESCSAQATGTMLYVRASSTSGSGLWFTLGSSEIQPYFLATYPCTPDDYVDTYLMLYASDGTTYMASDDDSGSGWYSQITISLASGTYYIKSENTSYTGTGCYYLKVTSGTIPASGPGTKTDDTGDIFPDKAAADAYGNLPLDTDTIHFDNDATGGDDWFKIVIP